MGQNFGGIKFCRFSLTAKLSPCEKFRKWAFAKLNLCQKPEISAHLQNF